MKTWVIEKGCFLSITDGIKTFIPTADQIYSSIIEEQAVWEDLAPGAFGASEGLEMSRFPANVILALTKDTDKSPPQASLVAFHSGKEIPLSSDAANVGHLIFENVWIPLDPGSLEEAHTVLKKFSIEPNTNLTFGKFLSLRQLGVSGAAVIEDRLLNATITPLSFLLEETDVPKDVRATLYPYQLDGWHWLKFVCAEGVGGILGDQMGLGKTLQIISVISDSGHRTVLPALIIAPGSLLENWKREFAKFAGHITTLKHNGPQRTGRPDELKNYDVVITSYDTVIRDNSLLRMIEWGVVVLDEAQNIKNPEALRTNSVKKLRRQSSLAVTGTPLENRLTDLWSIADFILPGYFGSLADFQIAYPDTMEGAARIESLLTPIMLRRLVADVAKDLPERIDIPQVIEMDEYESQEYEKIRQQTYEEFEKTASLVALGRLRMFCTHPLIAKGTTYSGDISNFGKYSRFVEIVEEIIASGEKAIVFTSFTEMADLIAEDITRRFGIFSGILDGRLGIDERQPLIDRFSETIGPAILVLNPRAGGAGLNITAANHVIHYNLEWNPALEDQASARAYRRGQTLPVTVHRIFYANTVEEAINERLLRKRELAGAAIMGVSGKEEDYSDMLSALQKTPSGKREK